jgi:hypothetical protein
MVVNGLICLCYDGTHLREKKHDEGAKGTVVVML